MIGDYFAGAAGMKSRCILAAIVLIACQDRAPSLADAGIAAEVGSTRRGENWQRMRECAEQATRVTKEHKSEVHEIDRQSWIMNAENHYSPKYERCYLREVVSSHPTGRAAADIPSFMTYIYDAFENRVLAECTDETGLKLAESFCRVHEPSTGAGCAACERYIDEHMDN
ncbi:MAG: hypothetical protein ABR567_22450 [Myxococcales bacterium]|nr:hypothetical protein [Myxococcales bacterium]